MLIASNNTIKTIQRKFCYDLRNYTRVVLTVYTNISNAALTPIIKLNDKYMDLSVVRVFLHYVVI